VEFRRALNEARLGRPMDDALAQMAERIGSEDFTFVIHAVAIQRQVGGSLAAMFDMVAASVRDRQQFGRRLRAVTAQGRLSAYVLVALPLGLGLILSVVNRSYMAPLFTTGGGRMMLVAGAVMMGFGALILKKIVSFGG
jgi:tight adherence protein B